MTRILGAASQKKQISGIRGSPTDWSTSAAHVSREEPKTLLSPNQATKELPVLLRHLKELAIYRNCLIAAQEFEFDPPKRPPQLPRYIR